MRIKGIKKHKKHKITMINVAPLVDVMLVLVIIFMITAPILTVGVQVDLPKTQATSTKDDDKSPIIISIDKDANIYVEEAQVSIEELLQKLPMILENGKSDVVYIRGDKNLQYGTIMEIMGIISSSGACKVSLISEAGSSSVNRNEKISAQKIEKSENRHVSKIKPKISKKTSFSRKIKRR